jgi:hypothetical protein
MPFTPFENLILQTELSYEEVCKRLDDVIGDPRGINPIAGRSEPYLGTFEKDQFKVIRDSSTLQAVKPTIRGKVKKVGSGSCVHLNMRPGKQANIFIIANFLLFSLGVIENLIPVIFDNVSLLDAVGDSIVLLAGALLWFTLVYVFLTISIKSESNKSRKFFIDLVEVYRVEELGIKSR